MDNNSPFFQILHDFRPLSWNGVGYYLIWYDHSFCCKRDNWETLGDGPLESMHFWWRGVISTWATVVEHASLPCTIAYYYLYWRIQAKVAQPKWQLIAWFVPISYRKQLSMKDTGSDPPWNWRWHANSLTKLQQLPKLCAPSLRTP